MSQEIVNEGSNPIGVATMQSITHYLKDVGPLVSTPSSINLCQ